MTPRNGEAHSPVNSHARADGATITAVRFTRIRDPFTPRHDIHMPRVSGDWSLIEICEVELASGVVGVGETIIQYTWGGVPRDAVAKVVGQNVFTQLWDDSYGCGLQMALWDAAGHQAGVPSHAFFGKQVRDVAPISWWCLDFDEDEWVAEARLAVSLGYTCFKLKGRPWRDVIGQLEALEHVLPDGATIDMDFNGGLANAGFAVGYLKSLERFHQLQIIESPIPQGDVAGNVRIRSQTRFAIAMHYGSPPIMTTMHEDVCDGFVIGGGAAALAQQSQVSATANKPFWLQLVGTGLTTAWTVQAGAVATHAQWPAITCIHIWEDDLIVKPLVVEGGYIKVPTTPGLGVTLDRDAVSRLQLADQEVFPVRPRRTYHLAWPASVRPGQLTIPSGSSVIEGFEHHLFRAYDLGNLPKHPHGITMKQVDHAD